MAKKRKLNISMSKKYIQKPGTKPGGMILEELRDQEIKNGDLKWDEDIERYVYIMKPFTKETIDTIIRIGGNGTLEHLK